jgi:hypothetical protein
VSPYLKYSLWAAGLAGAAWLAYEEGPKLWKNFAARLQMNSASGQQPTGGGGGGGGGAGEPLGSLGPQGDGDTSPSPPPGNGHVGINPPPGGPCSSGNIKDCEVPPSGGNGNGGGDNGGGDNGGGGGNTVICGPGQHKVGDHCEKLVDCPDGYYSVLGNCLPLPSTQSMVYTHPAHLASRIHE